MGYRMHIALLQLAEHHLSQVLTKNRTLHGMRSISMAILNPHRRLTETFAAVIMSASGAQAKHKYLVVPLNAGDPSRRSREQLLLTRKDVDLKLLNFMDGKDVPLETWLDCCMVSLESGSLDVFAKFTEKTAEVAQSRWRGRESNYLRIKALCCLGDMYVEQSRVVEDGVKKRELTNAANKAYFDAQRIDPKEMLPHIGIGEVAWITGNVSVARKEFQVAQRSRSNGRRSVAGHLALGRLEYASKNFSKALEWYRKALRECPECPSEVRAAIGACHFSLGNMKKARQAFERALELNPRCIIALIGIGIVDLSSGENGAMSLLRAYQQDPENPYAAILVSEYTMGQGMFEVSLQFAELALERIPFDDVGSRAEINGLIGRLYHAKGDIDNAIEYYKKAIKMDKASSRAARLGLAQLSTAKRDFVQAGNLFQSLMQEYPAWVDIATHFGPLIPHFKGTMLKNKSVINEFARMVEEIGNNANLWENLGDIVCIDDPAKAMKAYSKAIEIHKDASDSPESLSSVPCRLLNNAAVLYLRTGQSATAFRLESAAIENARSGNLGNLHPASQVTLGYNMARITEAMGDLRTAEKEYLDLLKEFPKYVDCILRLACICKKKGDINGAETWARKAAETSSNSADALALLAGIYLERRDLSSAKKCLEELQSALPTGASNVETYGRVALGNIHLYSIPGELHHSGNYEKAAVHLTNAMGLFKRALERDPGNLFAANGIGCVLAEAGRLNDAKEVFLRAQEASAATDGFITISDASVNLANVQLGLKQSKAAEATFKQAMKKHPSLQLDPRLLLYLARAQYESNNGEEAIKTVAKALHLAPADHRLRFNAAYLLQQGGAKVLHQTEFAGGEEGKVEAYRGAVLAFENSHRIFMGLQKIGQSSTGIATKKLDHHVGFAAEMHKSALIKLSAAEKEAAAASLKRNEQALRRKAAAKTKELEKQRRDAESKAEELRRQEIAKKTEEHLKHLKDAWKRGTALEKAVAEGDISGIQKPSAQPQDDTLDAYFANISEDDDEYVPGQEKMDAAPPEPGLDDDDDDEMDPLKAAGLLSSSDEDEEERGGDLQQNESGKRPRVEEQADTANHADHEQEAGNPPSSSSPTKKSRKLIDSDSD
ncbi:RNA polymerase-associated protein CTR9-like protein [Picochlorum sp. SENEW3]|nr:RNA polymerase-associated protein CTR9-like protein [Picochlorum sp. SENEW3]